MRTLEVEKKRSFKNEQERALSNILFSSEALKLGINKKLRPYRLKFSDWDVLRILEQQQGRPLSLDSIVQMSLIKAKNLNIMLQRFLQEDLVEETQFTKLSSKSYVLTEKGHFLMKQTESAYDNAVKDFTQRMSEIEARLLNNVLDKTRG